MNEATNGTSGAAGDAETAGRGSGADAAGDCADTAPVRNPARPLGIASGGGAARGRVPGAGGGRTDGGVPATVGGGGAGGGATDRAATGVTDLDEVALRRMLRGAVRSIEPSEGSLDQLHRAVPARRARRRQAVVGVAAAALLIGTGVPAFVHVANSEGPARDRPSIAGHGEQAQGGSGAEPGAETGTRGSDGVGTELNAGGDGESDSVDYPAEAGGAEAGASPTGGSADPSRPETLTMPVCGPEQLGVASATTGAAGADGTVYGSFRIANVSHRGCSVTSKGIVGFQARGAAVRSRIDVVEHTAGDAATGLPDPSEEEASVTLKPAMAYEVRFAWVPKESCTGAAASPTPTSPPSGGPGGSTTDGPNTGPVGAEPQPGGDDGGSGTKGEGSVSVRHTPEPGAPVAETTIPNACTGTIYRTGMLGAS
ncbi:hypothetical protein ACPXCE_22230 [Streptomyces sp. DT24]|uniref:hypothetical protein n=1 Tax=Streptomyces sp. DT24 TaxID=3416520 RepID=UPI003CF8FADE